LHAYLTQVSARGDYPQEISLFDFPLRFKFKRASWERGFFDLRELGQGTLLAEQPSRAVTFVENHDYQYGRDWESHVQEWFKPLAYAYILLRAGGYPCIFHADYYGIDPRLDGRGQAPGREYLQLLLSLRKHFALGEERYYDERNLAGWVRLGETSNARALAVVMNNGSAGVQCIWMDTERGSRRFVHLATLKSGRGPSATPGAAPRDASRRNASPDHAQADAAAGFQVLRGANPAYGDNAEALTTSSDGWAHFPAEAGAVALWLEELIP
jgi:alpha-amylase